MSRPRRIPGLPSCPECNATVEELVHIAPGIASAKPCSCVFAPGEFFPEEVLDADHDRELVADGGRCAGEPEQSEEKPTPPVPPTRHIPMPDAGPAERVVDREETSPCDCGGTIVYEEIATGDLVLAQWDEDQFDPDEYKTEIEYERTERRQRCTDCWLEVYV